MKHLLYVCLLLTSCTFHKPETRESLSLEGAWNFRIDSLDLGIEEQWYNQSLNQQVILPGSMAENGLGNEISLTTKWTGEIVDRSYFDEERYEKYRQPGNIKIPFWLKPNKYYKGPAWYQREVVIPDKWAGKQVILSLERPHWESMVFVNEKEAGSRNSLGVPHEYDLTMLLQPGVNMLSIRINNEMIVPVGVNSHSVSDHTQSNWNGIVGQILLEARPQVSISNIQIYPSLESGSARVVLTFHTPPGKSFEGEVILKAKSFNTDIPHSGPDYKAPVKVTGDDHSIEMDYPIGKDALPWSEFSPALYELEVLLTGDDGNEMDQRVQVFGMREFAANGTRFEINGHPVFLRGTLECCIFPLTGYPPTDEASWEYLLSRCKEHGLNHIRFHSWCPPEAAFKVADRMGFYFQVECGSWANQGSTIGDGGALDRYIVEEADRILESYGNHPSFCMMAYGNEPAGIHMNEYLVHLMESWRAKDQRRVYTAGAGWPLLPENDYHNGPQPRIQQWGAELTSVINGTPPQTAYDYGEVISAYNVPFVGHEIGQWCVYPDFEEIEKYTGVMKATNFEIFRESLEQNHMGDQSEEFLMASGKLQVLCYKAEIEAALRTPGFAGFQLLQLHDFPGQGSALVGVLDPFFNSKGYITPEEFRRFCNQTVPLARMDKRIYQNHETFSARIELSHSGSEPVKEARISCQIHDSAGKLLYESLLEQPEVPVANGVPVGSIEFELKEIKSAEKITLTVALEGTPYTNSWDLWVYPYEIDPQPGDIHITRKLDQKASQLLAAGGSVLLLTYGEVNQEHGAQVKIGFSSIFWNTAWTGGQAPHTLGILCKPEHAVFKHFPTEFHSNWQWWDPVTHSQTMILDDFPPELRPLIQPIDTWFENRRLGLLFETRVGAGKLMVCSINLQDDLNVRPVSRQLLHSILQYMKSPEFNPHLETGLGLIEALI